MKIVQPSVKLYKPLDWHDVEKIEDCGRVCYQSKKGDLSQTKKFVHNLIKNGHDSVLEHVNATFMITCDRGIMGELTRHRLASFCVESTRYCNYAKESLEFIKPSAIPEGTIQETTWLNAMQDAEKYYLGMIELGMHPQTARSVLPLALSCHMAMTANLREWRHVIQLRAAPEAHPDMRVVAGMVKSQLQRIMPDVFGDMD